VGTLLDLSQALLLRGDVRGAIDSAGRAVQLDESNPEAHHQLALALRGSGDSRAAISSFRKAVQFDQAGAFPHFRLHLAEALR
jgi:Flp pilus assembly protein TadD